MVGEKSTLIGSLPTDLVKKLRDFEKQTVASTGKRILRYLKDGENGDINCYAAPMAMRKLSDEERAKRDKALSKKRLATLTKRESSLLKKQKELETKKEELEAKKKALEA